MSLNLTNKRVACINCEFFEKLPVQKKEDTTLGACKANPPIPAPDYADSKLGIWPLVLGHFWCGIFTDVREESTKQNGAKQK